MTNNWYVFTGAPSSGKTTTLAFLEKEGYLTVPEAARTFIDQELAQGKTLTQIRENEEQFQEKILELKVQIEIQLDPQRITLFDRGLPDTAAYSRLLNFPISKEAERIYQEAKYHKVFLLEHLDFENDYARTEDTDFAIKLEVILEEVYRGYGIDVIRIPRLPLEERIDLIKKQLPSHA